MKKSFLKLTVAIAAVILLTATLAVVAVAEVYTGECGENLTYTLDTETEVLKIEGTGAMTDYRSTGNAPWASYSSNIKTVTIGNDVTSIGNYAFYKCKSIENVTIGNGVTNIGWYAFFYCTNLESVTIGDNVTSIGWYAFENCTSLTSVTIGNGVTSIGTHAFYKCTSIENAYYTGDLAGWCNIDFNDGSNPLYYGANLYINNVLLENAEIPDTVTAIEYTFSGCENLKEVTIPDSVKSIGSYAFYNCTNLESITIGNGVTSIGNSAFYKCTSIKNVYYTGDLAGWCNIGFYSGSSSSNPLYCGANLYINNILLENAEIPDTVTEIKVYAFRGYKSLKTVTIPDSVTSIGNYAFSGCTSLESVTIGNGVTSIGDNAFYNCTSLESVMIGNGVTSIGDNAFWDCTSLESVTIGNGVTSIGEAAFVDCTSIDNVYYTGDLAGWCNIGFSSNKSTPLCYGANLYINNVLLENAEIPDTVTAIDYTFCGYENLKTVTIPESMTSIGEYAFYNCSKLTSIEIPDSVTNIGSLAFCSCTGLTSVTIGNSVTSIGSGAFRSCTNLTGITVDENNPNYCSVDGILYNKAKTTLIQAPGAITECHNIPNSVESIDDRAFHDCTNLKGITIPNSLTSIGYMAFNNCAKITSITIPDSVTSIGYSAFHYCKSLSNLYISDLESWLNISLDGTYSHPLYYDGGNLYIDGVLATDIAIPNTVASVGNFAFYFCLSLTSVTIPESVTSIGDNAFMYCSNLESITIPGSATSIGEYAFQHCKNLASVNIPDNVTSIGSWAFDGCTGLESVTIGNSLTSIGSYVFSNCDSLTRVVIPNNVTSVGFHAFSGCGKLTNVVIGSNVASIGTNAFSWCSILARVTFLTKDVTINSTIFANCPALKTICLYKDSTADKFFSNEDYYTKIYLDNMEVSSDFIYSVNDDGISVTITKYIGEDKDVVISSEVAGYNVTNIGNNAFDGCTSLASIEIPDSVESIGDSAFCNCTSLASATIGNDVTSIGESAFRGCTSLASIEIPDSVTSIGDHAFSYCMNLANATIGSGVTSIGEAAFESCTSLTSIAIPDSVESIGDSGFCNCTSLESATIGNSVTSIGEAAFESCTSLERITIPNNVTSIGNFAFRGCTSLESVTIGNGVTSIGSRAFHCCTGLTSIRFEAKDATIGTGAFDECTSLKTIYLYRNSPADRFFSDEEYTKIYPGDVYTDGVVDMKDLVLLEDYLAERVDEIDLMCADTNDDGAINAVDAVMLFRYITDCYQYHSTSGDADFSSFAPRGELLVPEGSDDPDAPKLVLKGKQTGNVFEVTVSAVGNPGVKGVLFELTYDSKQLTLTNISYNSKFEQTSCYDPEDPPEEYLCTHPISFFSYQNKNNISSDGVWATLTFEVAEKYYLYGDIDYDTIFFSKFDSSNADFEYVEFACESQLEYTITYVSNVDAPEAQVKLYDEPITLPNITTEVKNSKFAGWSLYENGAVNYLPGDAYTRNESVTLYAVWRPTVNYYFDETTGSLYISGEGEIQESKIEALCTASTLKSLRIGEGITSIPGRCFNGYSNLANIYIADTVDSIGELTFDGTAYYNDESNWDEDGVLYINNHLIAAKTTLSGEYRVPEGTRSISNSAFLDCTELKDIYIPGTVKTVYPGSLLGCNSLRKIFFGEGVETIKNNVLAMPTRKKLSLIVIPKSVTTIENEGNSFYEEYSDLVAIPTIYVHTGSSLTTNFGDAEIVYYASSGDCGNDVTWEFDFLTGVLEFTGSGAIVPTGSYTWKDLSDFITEVHIDIEITEIGNGAFKDCTKLETVYFCAEDEFGEYWYYMGNSKLVSIGNDAFNNCQKLKYLGSFPSTLKTIGDKAFKGCRIEDGGLGNFESIESIGTEAFCNCTAVDFVDLINCKTVGNKAFFGSSASSVIIGEQLTQIGISAFVCCDQLDKFDVDYNNPNYSSYNGYLCNKEMTELICAPANMYVCDIPDSITKICNSALAQPGIIGLTLPENATITSAFAGDSDYTAFYETVFISKNYVSKTVLEKLVGTVIGEIVYYDETYSGTCGDNLTWTLDIQYGGYLAIEGIGDMYDFYEEQAPWWKYRHGITSIGFNGEITSIGAMAFADHWRIDHVSFTPELESIGEGAFLNCMNLSDINFEYSNIKHIGIQAFAGTGFYEVILSDGIESIGDCAFSSIQNLKTIYIPESVKEIGSCIVCGNDMNLDFILLHKGSYADEYFSGDEFFSQKVRYVDEAYGECSETISWRFDWDSGKLILSGSGAFDGYEYTEEAPWEPYENFVRDIIIGEGITHVGKLDFSYLWSKNVWFPKSVTSIDEYLINACWYVFVYTDSYADRCFSDHGVEGVKNYLDGKCGKNLKYFYDYTRDILTISGSGDMYDFGENGSAPWSYFNPSTVFISEGVTSISDFAFVHSSGLEKLYIPKSVTKLPNPEYEGHFGYDNDYDIFCIYLHQGSYADEYFMENYDYNVKYLSVLENEGGISISGESGTDYPENTEIVVEVVDDEEGDIVIEGHNDNICSLDITLVCNGVETQPNDTIFVRIKVPEGFKGDKCKVYHKTDDGQLVDMNAVYEDGYLVFATNHFSVYVVAELLAADSGDINGDGEINATDSVLLAQHLANWDVELDIDAADCNGDGTVNAADAVLLAQYLASWDVTLG